MPGWFCAAGSPSQAQRCGRGPVAFKAAIAQSLRQTVWPLLENGSVKPVIHSVFAAADAGKAHVLMESNQHIGKIVLT